MLQPIRRLREFVGCAVALGKTPASKWSIFWRQTKNLRVRLKLAAYRPSKVYSLETIYGRFWLRDNFGDITNLPDLIHANVYQVRPLAHEGVILDIGANIGLAAALLAHHNPHKRIYCFEPLSSNTGQIARNCPQAQIEQVALGQYQDRVALRVDPDSVMASSIPCAWETGEEEFEVIPLDEYAREKGIDQVALMKIDTEGMEVEILKGAHDTLLETQQVVMETHSQSLHDEAIELLQQASFRIVNEQFNETTGMVFATCDVAMREAMIQRAEVSAKHS